MSTVGQLVDRTLNRWLLGTYRARVNVLAQDADAVATDLQLQLPLDQLGLGSFLALDDELCYVVDASSGGKVVTVLRGQRGTTAVPHSAGAMVEVNPRFPRVLVREAMREDMTTWPDSVYWVDDVETPIAAFTGAINVTDAVNVPEPDVISVLKVWRESRAIDSAKWHEIPFVTADLGGYNVELYLDIVEGDSYSYRLVVARRFNPDVEFTDATDVLADLHLPPQLEDVLCIGAAWRLITGKETRRLDIDAAGESRTATEVHERENARFGEQLRGLRNTRLGEEGRRLTSRFGITRGGLGR